MRRRLAPTRTNPSATRRRSRSATPTRPCTRSGRPAGELPALVLEGPDELQRAEDEERPDHDPGQREPRVERGRLQHRRADEHGPRAREQVAEALSDRDSEVAVQSVERDRGRLSRALARARALVGPRERRDEERPAGDPRNCTVAASTPTVVITGTIWSPSRASNCPGGRRPAEQHGREHEPVPSSLSCAPPRGTG